VLLASLDFMSVTLVIPRGVISPFWEFVLVFKFFTDSSIFDDFRSALDKPSHHRPAQIPPFNVLEGQYRHFRVSRRCGALGT
jgi:hypothetical protein